MGSRLRASALTWMKRGTKLKSWKYRSSLSFKVWRLVLEKAYGPIRAGTMLKGVMMVYFWLSLPLFWKTVRRSADLSGTQQATRTHRLLPSSNDIACFDNLHVESIFSTCRRSDWLDSIRVSRADASSFRPSLIEPRFQHRSDWKIRLDLLERDRHQASPHFSIRGSR